MRVFYFVGGPTLGNEVEFYRRLEQAGGPPPGWRIYPHASGDRSSRRLGIRRDPVTTMTLDAKVQDFLAQKRIAVAGVSRDNSHHPVGNLIYHRLKRTGHDVVSSESAYADVRG